MNYPLLRNLMLLSCQYGVHLPNWKAVLVWIGLIVFIVIIPLTFAIHFFVWIFWYPAQIRQWKRDFQNAYDEEEKQRLLNVRKRIRRYWIPFYFIKKF